MKKLAIVLIALIFSCMNLTFAQQKYYMEITASRNTITTNVKASLNLGKTIIAQTALTKDQEKQIEKMKFGSMSDAMNFLSSKGWTLEDTYTATYDSWIEYYWVVSKTVSDPKELLEGLLDQK